MMSGETESILGSFPGFKFSPTDEELILFYLKKKIEGSDDKSVNAIKELNISEYEPWDILAKSNIQLSDDEWYFYSPRGKRYPKGLQTKRSTATGYWKLWGESVSVKSGSGVIGTKKTLVFHKGCAPNGEKTEWILHEFYMKGTPNKDSYVICRLSIEGEPNLDQVLAPESSTRPLEGLESGEKDEKKSGRKRKNEYAVDFFANPPEEVIWALVDEDEGVWEPSIANKRVPVTSTQEWTTIFNRLSQMDN